LRIAKRSRLDEYLGTLRDKQDMTTRCAWCNWSFSGSAADGRLAAAKHRETRHTAGADDRAELRALVARLKPLRQMVKELDPNIARRDPSFRTAVIVLACWFHCGPDPERLAAFTNYPLDFVSDRVRNMCNGGLWLKDGTFKIDTPLDGDQEILTIEFWLQCGVADGHLEHSPDGYQVWRDWGYGLLRHGINGYWKGCRCEPCREANNRRHRSLIGKEPPKHGTVSAYRNYQCRCEQCKAAGSWDNFHQRARRKVKAGKPLTQNELAAMLSERPAA
jgi:hypothetical protein